MSKNDTKNNKNDPELEEDRHTDLEDIEFLKLDPKASGDKQKNMRKTRKRTIIICVAAFAVLTVLYFAVIAPMLKNNGEKPPEIFEGEMLGSGNRVLIFPTVERSDIVSIDVHNENGDYSFTYLESTDSFYLTENSVLWLNDSTVSQAVVAARYPLSMERLTTEATDKEIDDYGLAEEDSPAWYMLTDNTGKKHKIYIGDDIVTGMGCYCMYEGRRSIYILDKTIMAFKQPVEYFVSPIITYPASSTDFTYNITNCKLERDGETVFDIKHLSQDEMTESALLTEYEMVEPAGYVPSESNYPHILQEFCDFEGTATVYAPLESKTPPAEKLDEYGVSPEKAKYILTYFYNIENGSLKNVAYFSEADENGGYYAYSLLFGTISYVTKDKTYFLDWDFIDFVDRSLFQRNINDIAEISIESDTNSETFILEGSGDDIRISQKSNGKVYNGEMVSSFRKLYIKLLSLNIEDYTESTGTENCLMTLRITTDAGRSFEYKFYPYSTRRCFFTIDGVGRFYVLRPAIEQLIEDVATLQSGGMVNGEDFGY